MPTKIKPIGSFFPLNEQGYVLNPSSRLHINKKWTNLIAEVKATIIQKFGKELHSIYLRGSVARGLTMDGAADLDMFVLLHREGLRWEVADWLGDYQTTWRERFPFVKEIEVGCTSFSENFFEANPRLSMIIKTQSLLLHGPDLAVTLPDFKPSKSMMLNHTWLAEDLEDFFAKAKPQADDIQIITKVLLRTGFELVMEREKQYTIDLYPCWQAFAKYYPDRAGQMELMLHYYLNPEEDLKTFVECLRDLGDWMSAEIETRIGKR